VTIPYHAMQRDTKKTLRNQGFFCLNGVRFVVLSLWENLDQVILPCGRLEIELYLKTVDYKGYK
jgi:hypothetical protein